MKYFILLVMLAVVWAEPEKKQDNKNNAQVQQQQQQQQPQLQQQPQVQPQARQILLYNQNGLPFDGQVPQIQTQQFPGFINDRPLHPRLEPQVLIYPGGAGQPFLLQPGHGPNFLIPQQPQPGPGYVLRNEPPLVYGNNQPERPIFVSGFPKPAHIPKIEPDAEEIPTDPSAIPPFRPQKFKGKNPAKIESFNDPEPIERPLPGKVEHEEIDRHNKKQIPSLPPVKPGQRFFILNGQQLFSHSFLPQILNEPYQPAPAGRVAYPLGGGGFVHPNQFPSQHHDFYNTIPRANSPFDHQLFNHIPQQNIHKTYSNEAAIQNLLLRNSVTGQIDNVRKDFGQIPPQQPIFQTAPQHQDQSNLYHLYNQPEASQVFRSSLPLPVTLLKQQPQEILHQPQQGIQSRFNEDGVQLEPILFQNGGAPPQLYDQGLDALQYVRYDGSKYDGNGDDDSVVIDAKIQDDKTDSEDTESEAITPPQKSEEPSIAQAAPGAIALAGPGGVASSGPRGTALAGVGGLAVSSPRATAVAGPKDDEQQKKKKATKDKE